LKEHHIILLTESFPDRTAATLIDKGVVHFTGKGVTDEELTAVSIKDAAHVLIIAGHDTDPASDALTLDIMARMHEQGFKGSTIIELVNDTNRPRALRMGADAIVRPARGYPEMLIRAMDAPGSEVILENFFDSEGAEITRVNLPAPANRIWGEILFDLGKNDVGTAVGYLDASGKVITNPPFKLHVDSSVLFVIVDDTVAQPLEACCKALSIQKAKKAA
jgi:voltage-gated potassium channel